MMYSGSETSSSTTNRAMKLLTMGKSIMPARENSMSGKTSVAVQPWWRDSVSSALPGRSAAWAAKAPSPAVVRSAMTSTDSSPMTSIMPCAATAKGSSLIPEASTRPDGETWPVPGSCGRTCSQRSTKATPEPRMASTDRPACTGSRPPRGTKASKRTPSTPAPRMMRTGARPAHSIVGTVKLTCWSLP